MLLRSLTPLKIRREVTISSCTTVQNRHRPWSVQKQTFIPYTCNSLMRTVRVTPAIVTVTVRQLEGNNTLDVCHNMGRTNFPNFWILCPWWRSMTHCQCLSHDASSCTTVGCKLTGTCCSEYITWFICRISLRGICFTSEPSCTETYPRRTVCALGVFAQLSICVGSRETILWLYVRLGFDTPVASDRLTV